MTGGAQAPFSICMHATFLYEQQVQREQETVLKCMQTLHMQLGIAGHLPLRTRTALFFRPQAALEGSMMKMTLFSSGSLLVYLGAPVYFIDSLSMWSSAGLPVTFFTTLPLIETYS